MKAWRNVLMTFGVITVPVSIAPAVESKRSFESHKYGPNGQRVRQAFTEDGVTILDPGSIATLYVGPSGEPVEIEPPEIPGDNGIALAGLVPLASIDPVFYDTAYAMNAGKGAGAAFAAILAALEDRPGAAIVGEARFTDRPRAVLVRYSPEVDGLILHTLTPAGKVRRDEMTAEAAKLPAPDPAAVAAAGQFMDGLPAAGFAIPENDAMDDAIAAALAAAVPSALTPPAPGDVTAPRDLLADLRAAGIE